MVGFNIEGGLKLRQAMPDLIHLRTLGTDSVILVPSTTSVSSIISSRNCTGNTCGNTCTCKQHVETHVHADYMQRQTHIEYVEELPCGGQLERLGGERLGIAILRQKLQGFTRKYR